MEDSELSAENFLDAASEKIIQALSNSHDVIKYKWAVSFLQRAARGFGDVNHEPWIGPLSLKECSEVLLLTYKQFLPNCDLKYSYLNSMLRAVVKSSLNVNDLISELVTAIVNKNISCENILVDVLPQKKVTELECQCIGSIVPGEVNAKIENIGNDNTLKKNPLRAEWEECNEKYNSENNGNCKNRQDSNNEVKELLNNIWIWVCNDRVQLSPEITSKLLSLLPEKVEEIMLDIALEVVKNSISRKKLVSDLEEDFGGKKTSINNDAYIVDSVLQDNVLIVEAARSNPKLFQMCSSILNQILIQSSGCSEAWSAMLTLCSRFAKETSHRKAAFYPISVQTAVFWMNIELGKIKSKEFREEVMNHITTVFEKENIESAIALFSHFPEWLPFLNFISVLYCYK